MKELIFWKKSIFSNYKYQCKTFLFSSNGTIQFKSFLQITFESSLFALSNFCEIIIILLCIHQTLGFNIFSNKETFFCLKFLCFTSIPFNLATFGTMPIIWYPNFCHILSLEAIINQLTSFLQKFCIILEIYGWKWNFLYILED